MKCNYYYQYRTGLQKMQLQFIIKLFIMPLDCSETTLTFYYQETRTPRIYRLIQIYPVPTKERRCFFLFWMNRPHLGVDRIANFPIDFFT